MLPVNDLITEFLTECHANIEMLERHLSDLESPPEPHTLHEMFRAIHTIKGSAGFLALPKLEVLTHAAESVLGDLREGTLSFSPQMVETLSHTASAIRRILGQIKEDGKEGDEDNSELIATLNSYRG
jgi:two-component system chemotaxis sensor kinase CheA